VPKQTAYARVISGEIPILLDYDFDAYRAKYTDGSNIAFVIPAEGTISVPYVMSLVANAYLRPVRASAMSPEAQKKFLPESEYARAGTVDYLLMANAQRAFSDRYSKEIQ